MRCPYGAIVIFIIFFKESEASDSSSSKWNWTNMKLKLPKKATSKGEQDRRDILGTPKHTNPADFPKQRRTPAMDLVTQPESHAMNLLTQYRAQNPRSRSKSRQKSLRENNLAVDSNPLYPTEPGPAPPNQLLMNSQVLSESQMFQMGLQRYGEYAPLHPKPPRFPTNSEAFGPYYGTAGGSSSGASGYPNTQLGSYFETEEDQQIYRMAGQRHGNYSPLYSNSPYLNSDSEHSGSGDQY